MQSSAKIVPIAAKKAIDMTAEVLQEQTRQANKRIESDSKTLEAFEHIHRAIDKGHYSVRFRLEDVFDVGYFFDLEQYLTRLGYVVNSELVGFGIRDYSVSWYPVSEQG